MRSWKLSIIIEIAVNILWHKNTQKVHMYCGFFVVVEYKPTSCSLGQTSKLYCYTILYIIYRPFHIVLRISFSHFHLNINKYIFIQWKTHSPAAISWKNPFQHFEKKIFAQFIFHNLFDKFIWICILNGICLWLVCGASVFGQIFVCWTIWTLNTIFPFTFNTTYEICLYLIFELYILSMTDYKSTNIYFTLIHTVLQLHIHCMVNGHYSLKLQLQRNA